MKDEFNTEYYEDDDIDNEDWKDYGLLRKSLNDLFMNK